MAVKTHAGRYELEQLIGSGGMAAVYRGFDRRLERRVAVKILHASLSSDPEVVERFQREARAVAQLHHPNLVSVIDRGDAGGRPYIVLEYVEGETLEQLLRRRGPLPAGRALAFVIEAGRGLAFAHNRGVIHRDVKPENVIIGKAGAKVTDFGDARALGLDELTLSGIGGAGSAYVAPEQASGGQVDARSDVYSLGVVLFELLTGELPYQGRSGVEVAMQVQSARPPALVERSPGASPRLAAAVERSLALDPGERFATMDAFVDELASCLGDEESDTETFELGAAVRPRGRRRVSGGWLAGAALAGAGAIAALVIVLLPGHGSPHATTPPLLPPASHHVPPAAPIHVRAVAAYDPPPGDGVEDNAGLHFATDGKPATFWSTEWYATEEFGGLKHGVGMVVDAGRPLRLRNLTILTDTPGYQAVIKAGSSEQGPFRAVSADLTVRADTRFPLREDASARFYLIWITALAPATAPHFQAHVNEVAAS